MAQIKIKVKWGKKIINLEIDTEESFEQLQSQIFSETDVPPDRQKIMGKGKVLKDTSDIKTLKENQTLMMTGTAGSLPEPTHREPVKFLEDMDEDEIAQTLDIPSGLENLGNTCYMNSTLQCLRAIPGLHTALDAYSGAVSGTDSRAGLIASLRDLYKNLSKNREELSLLIFWQMLKQVFPQFSQTGPEGIPMQQDAEECWSEIVSVLKAKLPADETTGHNFIEQYMTGEIQREIKCVEAPEEEPKKDTEHFSKLSCHISISTNHMTTGIIESLTEEIEKTSPTLDRNAKYKRVSQVSRLPYYLPVHFVRFFWKPESGVKAKILKKVKFPLEFDATELCVPELQQKFSKAKTKLKEIEDAALQKKRDEKRRKIDLEVSGQSSSTPQPATGGGESKDMDVDKEAKVDWSKYIDPELQKDQGCNPTGQYELCAVLTHVGRSADSGHYIGWVKKSENEWHKFDDEKVSVVRDADIQKLDGGGDWPMAYIVLYRAKQLV